MTLGGKPNGISPAMLLELTSLQKPENGSELIAYLDNQMSSEEANAIQTLTVASNDVDYRACIQDSQ